MNDIDIDVEIRSIDSQNTYPIRLEVLRPGGTIDDVKWEQDFDEETHHLGAFHNSKCVAICTLIKNRHPELEGKVHYQLRGMATLTEYQGKGIAGKLFSRAEGHLKNNNIDTLWCRAREVAFHFYESRGMKFHGKTFTIENIGPHRIMYKYLLT